MKTKVYLNEDTEVSDEYYFSQIEYIEEGIGAFLQFCISCNKGLSIW